LIEGALRGGGAILTPMNGEQTIKVGDKDVPVSVATFYAMDQMLGLMRELVIRTQAVHHHLAAREHPKSRTQQTCMVCMAQQEMMKAAAEAAEEGQEGDSE
jgi:hypothetical protein